MDFKEYDNETLYEVRLLDYCMHTLEKGMEFLEEKGIKSEFSFNKQNIFGTQFNEEFSFKTIKDDDKFSLFNSIQFESGDINTIFDKAFRYIALNGFDDFGGDLSDYDYYRIYDDDEVRKEIISEIISSDYNDIPNLAIKNIDTNLNYDKSIRNIEFTISSINPDDTKLKITKVGGEILETNPKDLEIGLFFKDEEYIKSFVEDFEKTQKSMKNFEKLPKENVVETNEKPPFIRYKFDNDYGLLVTNKFVENNKTGMYVETEENPYRVQVLKYDDKDNYFVDRFTKATQVVINEEKGNIAYDFQLSHKSVDEVNKLVEEVKGYEKTKTLSPKETKEAIKELVENILDKDTKEHKSVVNKNLDNHGVKIQLKEMFKMQYKELAVCVKEKTVFNNIEKEFENKGIENYVEYIKLAEHFDKEKLDEFMKTDSNFEKKVFNEIKKDLKEEDDKVMLKTEAYTYTLLLDRSNNFDLNKKIDKIIGKTINEVNLTDEEVVKFFDMEDKLPEYLVFVGDDLAFSSDFLREFDENANKKFLELSKNKNVDIYNIKELAELEEISVSYINSKKEVVPFTSYDEYIEDVAEKLATNGMKDRFVAIAEDLKENLYELSKNNESKYFNKKDFEKFEKKIDERLNLFDKKRETKKEKIKEELKKNKDDLEMDM